MGIGSMSESSELRKQQDARLAEIISRGRQRYLEAGGDPRRCPSGIYGDDYLTDEERQEAILLMRQLAGIKVKNGFVYCQGRSWKLPDSLVRQEDEAIQES
jgi:hypothetical protein